MKKGQKFRDRWGKVWTLRWFTGYASEGRWQEGWMVWNEETKWGLWDNGKGLTRI